MEEKNEIIIKENQKILEQEQLVKEKKCIRTSEGSIIENLTGIKFHQLEVLYYSHSKKATSKRGYRHYWICRCFCKKLTEICSDNIRAANIKSCGCARNGHPEDITGKKYNGVEAIRFLYKKGETQYWLFKCRTPCNKEFVAPKHGVISGKTKSCGHLRYREDITGKVFGELQAERFLRRDYTKSGKKKDIWEWKCLACKSNIERDLIGIIRGKTVHCGCKGRKTPEFKLKPPKILPIKAGDKFKNWVAIDLVGRPNKYTYWNFQCCNCGDRQKLIAEYVIRGKKTGRNCPCQKTERYARNKSVKWTGCGEMSGSHWGRIVRRAERDEIEFDLNKEYLWELFLNKQNRRCAYTNTPIQFFTRRHAKDETASLDRVDNTKGYKEGNVVWCHKIVNSMKLALTVEEFARWCKLVYLNSLKGEAPFIQQGFTEDYQI